ncbi:MAG: hypothetical protein K2O27_11115, partial [Candidatus Amulumruptor sp.]|nr:hypothetical protein [Candidatus Amulumruptor sp.]
INDTPGAAPGARASQSSFTLSLDITMMRRTLTVTYTSGADNVSVTVISTDEKGIRRSIASGATVEVDTELLFQATPNDGYEIESVKIIPITGLTLTSTAANFDTDGVCSLTTLTPVIVENNAVASYKIEIVAREKQTVETYKPHYVTIAVADGQADYGSVRFINPTSDGKTIVTDRKVTFEAIPAALPSDGTLGRYSFAGWSSNIPTSENESETAQEALTNAVYSYGGDDNAKFTASFIKNCKLIFNETHTGGTMRITDADGTPIESDSYVAPGTEITVTVIATPSTAYRVNLITVNGAVAYLFDDCPSTVTQTITVTSDMMIGCDIFIPTGIDTVDDDTDETGATWFTLNGVRLGTERPSAAGIYIVVSRNGRSRKVKITAD